MVVTVVAVMIRAIVARRNLTPCYIIPALGSTVPFASLMAFDAPKP